MRKDGKNGLRGRRLDYNEWPSGNHKCEILEIVVTENLLPEAEESYAVSDGCWCRFSLGVWRPKNSGRRSSSATFCQSSTNTAGSANGGETRKAGLVFRTAPPWCS